VRRVWLPTIEGGGKGCGTLSNSTREWSCGPRICRAPGSPWWATFPRSSALTTNPRPSEQPPINAEKTSFKRTVEHYWSKDKFVFSLKKIVPRPVCSLNVAHIPMKKPTFYLVNHNFLAGLLGKGLSLSEQGLIRVGLGLGHSTAFEV
jgi:hypothetical protein